MQSGIYIIAEIGQAHEGSLELAHSYIDALAETGVNAVKFQVHIADAESSIYEPFRIPFSYLSESRMQYWKRMEFTAEQWKGLKSHCEERSMDFLATPSSITAAKLLNDLKVEKIKVGSGDSANLLLLDYLVATGKEIILSSGMSTTEELDHTVGFLKSRQAKFSILQCTSAYPTQPEQWGLNLIKELRDRYQVRTGFSDHSGAITACLAAASCGAEILEFHVVFDKRMFGPDAASSITIDQCGILVKGVRQIETALSNPLAKSVEPEIFHFKNIFEKSLAVNKDLKQGQVISISDLECKKPKNMGIAAEQYANVIGRKIRHDMDQWTFLNYTDLL